MTTITLAPAVKRELDALKPDALTWDDYLVVLLESVDPDRFERVIKALIDAQREEAVARARERYRKARDRPDELLTPAQARERVRALRAGEGGTWHEPARSPRGTRSTKSATRPKRSRSSRSTRPRSG